MIKCLVYGTGRECSGGSRRWRQRPRCGAIPQDSRLLLLMYQIQHCPLKHFWIKGSAAAVGGQGTWIPGEG